MIGSSNNDKFIVTHFDLYVVSSTDYNTYIKPTFKERCWNQYVTVKKVGQIPLNEIQAFHTPFLYGKELEYKLLRFVYYPLLDRNNGPKWSSILNCQTYTRSAIEYLGCQFPSDIQLISDCIPTMFDIYLCVSLKTGETSAKLSK